MSYSFRVVVVSGQPPAVAEISGDLPEGVYQVSGHEAGPGEATHAHTLSIVRHDPDGTPVIGASGYGN